MPLTLSSSTVLIDCMRNPEDLSVQRDIQFMYLIRPTLQPSLIARWVRYITRKLRVFENMVLRRLFGPRRDEVTGNGGDCITRS